MKGTRTCRLGAALCAIAVSYCIASYSYADNCGENSAGTHHVCATWDQGGLPSENFDFFVDYTCDEGCSDAPKVTLKSAAGWTIYSEVISSGAAANLGSVVLHEDVTPNDGDFSLNILNGTDPGAVALADLYL